MLNQESCPSKSILLKTLNEVSFAISDILLYLDTHPFDKEALCFFHENEQRRKELMKLYTRFYGPLTIDYMADSDSDKWLWEQQPFPWEKEGGCKDYVEL